MKWTQKKFKEHFGEDPEDLFGPDWQNYIEEYSEKREKRSEFLMGLHGNGLSKF